MIVEKKAEKLDAQGVFSQLDATGILYRGLAVFNKWDREFDVAKIPYQMSQINDRAVLRLPALVVREAIKDSKTHSKQDLVNLLKHPLCRHQARRAILDELGQRTGQQCADVWAFVAWAERDAPDLDVRSPWQPAKK